MSINSINNPVQNYFEFNELPTELQRVVLDFLPLRDLVQSRPVSSRWKKLVMASETMVQIKTKVVWAKEIASGFSLELRIKALIEVAKVEAGIDLVAAQETLRDAFQVVSFTKDRHYFHYFKKVAEVQKELDTEGAKITLNKAAEVASPRSQAQRAKISYYRTLVELADIRRQVDPQTTKEMLIEARKFAETIESTDLRYRELLAIAKVQVKIDLEGAKETLSKANLAKPRKLFQSYMNQGVEKALEAFYSKNDLSYYHHQKILSQFNEILKEAKSIIALAPKDAEAKLLLQKAIKLILDSNIDHKFDYFLKAVKIQVHTDPEGAKMALQEITKENVSFDQLLSIAKLQMCIDLPGAEITIQKAQEAATNTHNLLKIAMLLDPQELPAILGQVNKEMDSLPHSRIDFHINMAYVQSRMDLSKAKETLASAFDRIKIPASASELAKVNNRVLIDVIRTQADIDPKGAKMTLQSAILDIRSIHEHISINDYVTREKSYMLSELAIIQLNLEPTEALKTVQSISNIYTLNGFLQGLLKSCYAEMRFSL